MPELSFLHASYFYELTALLVLGYLGLLLRQPMIVCFIAIERRAAEFMYDTRPEHQRANDG